MAIGYRLSASAPSEGCMPRTGMQLQRTDFSYAEDYAVARMAAPGTNRPSPRASSLCSRRTSASKLKSIAGRDGSAKGGHSPLVDVNVFESVKLRAMSSVYRSIFPPFCFALFCFVSFQGRGEPFVPRLFLLIFCRRLIARFVERNLQSRVESKQRDKQTKNHPDAE
jgi:hypothetical protein